jgi:hypothetical protein
VTEPRFYVSELWGYPIPASGSSAATAFTNRSYRDKPSVSCTVYDRYYEKPLLVGYFEARSGQSSKHTLKLAYHRCERLNAEQGWPDED